MLAILRKSSVVCAAVTVTLLSLLAPIPNATADVVGRLKIQLQCSDDKRPLDSVRLVIHDEAGIRADTELISDQNGEVTSPPLENRSWSIRINDEHFYPLEQQVQVVAGSVTSVSLVLTPTITTIKISGSQSLLQNRETANATSRSLEFSRRFPVSAQNGQQLNGLLSSTPGFVEDSVNQIHPRGEHSATSIYIQGFQLGGATQGRFGPVIDPDALETVEIMTGGFAAEYAGGAAILNSTVRSGSSRPFSTLDIGGGNWDTGNMGFSVGGQAGTPIGQPSPEGLQSKIFSYFLTASARSTDNALEAPQPDVQSAHNHGTSQTMAGRFDLNPSSSDQYTFIFGASPAETQIANRTGLSDRYAAVGQGYGYGGMLSAVEAQEQGILTQDQLGQDIYQRDRNSFALLQWRHEFSDDLSGMFSFGADQSRLDTRNTNPAIDLAALPYDNSIEYNPDVSRDAKHYQVSGSLTKDIGSHSLKVGSQFTDESSDDSYELTPASQLAVNALATSDERLAPAGAFVFDADGQPVLDKNGNQVYQLSPGAQANALGVNSTGYFAATYLQDTWRMTEQFTANYGIRYDRFVQNQNLAGRDVVAQQFSPRVNLSWAFLPKWVARSSYNRLLIEPPLAQGAVLGDAIKPERVQQYEASLEREIGRRQRVKASWYLKQIRDQIDTGLLIPSTQMGLFTSVNLDRARVHGIEFSYDLFPEHGHGFGAYTAYAYSVARPSGFDNTGEPVEKYNDHDQRHTLSTGVSYVFSNDTSIATNLYYGSGVASSVLTEDGSRDARTRVNLSIASPPKMLFGKGALKLTATNLFDDRSVINFNSPFSGTRFQQAQSFLLSAEFRF